MKELLGLLRLVEVEIPGQFSPEFEQKATTRT
jgi:hypothetical protein